MLLIILRKSEKSMIWSLSNRILKNFSSLFLLFRCWITLWKIWPLVSPNNTKLMGLSSLWGFLWASNFIFPKSSIWLKKKNKKIIKWWWWWENKGILFTLCKHTIIICRERIKKILFFLWLGWSILMVIFKRSSRSLTKI